MIRPSFAWRSVAVLGAACLTLAACADDGDTPSTGSSSAAAATAAGDGVLKIGTLLPQTGSLAFLGPPEFAGVDLAIKDINAAGGVLGKDVVQSDPDSGDTSTDIASQSVNKLLTEKVDAIVGAASSGVSLTVIDKITGSGVVQFSPANTSPTFTDYKDNGLYFRTAPSDVLQGRVLGDLMIEDGASTVGILALQDPYGTGLADNVKKSVTDGGGEEFGGIDVSGSLTQYRLRQLEEKVNRHNNLIERTFRLEQECAVLEERVRAADRRIDGLEEEQA